MKHTAWHTAPALYYYCYFQLLLFTLLLNTDSQDCLFRSWMGRVCSTLERMRPVSQAQALGLKPSCISLSHFNAVGLNQMIWNRKGRPGWCMIEAPLERHSSGWCLCLMPLLLLSPTAGNDLGILFWFPQPVVVCLWGLGWSRASISVWFFRTDGVSRDQLSRRVTGRQRQVFTCLT